MLKISNIKKNYGQTEVLKYINIKASKGDFLFITGYSGCGKTTLLNIIAGLQGYGEGSITINDKNVSSNDLIKNTSYIFQDYKLIDNFNVLENLSITTNKSEKEITNVLKSLGIDELKKHLVKNISGGQKQRVAIARTILKDTDIILCDEPTGNLDKNNAMEVFELLKETFKDKLVIIVSHNKKLAKQYATDIIDLDSKTTNYKSNKIDLLMLNNERRKFKKLSKLLRINIRRNFVRVATYCLFTIITLFSLLIQVQLRDSGYEDIMIDKIKENYIVNTLTMDVYQTFENEQIIDITRNGEFVKTLSDYENIENLNIVRRYGANFFTIETEIPPDVNKSANLIVMDRSTNSLVFEDDIIVGRMPVEEDEVLMNFDSFLISQDYDNRNQLLRKYYNNELSNQDIIKLFNEMQDVYAHNEQQYDERVKINVTGIVSTKDHKDFLQIPVNDRYEIDEFYPNMFTNNSFFSYMLSGFTGLSYPVHLNIYLKDSSAPTRLDTLEFIENEISKEKYDMGKVNLEYWSDTTILNDYYNDIVDGVDTYKARSYIIIIVTFIITFISLFVTFAKRKENYLKYKRFLYKDKQISLIYNIENIIIVSMSSTIVISLYYLTYYNLSNLMFGLNIEPNIGISLILTIVGSVLLLYILSSIIAHLIYYTKFKLKLK